MIIEGPSGLEIFTEKYLKIHPISNVSKVVYYLETTHSLAGIYIFNPNRDHYLLSVAKGVEITPNQLEPFSYHRMLVHAKVIRFPNLSARVCPEKPLVFPTATGPKCFSLKTNLVIQTNSGNSLILCDQEGSYFDHYFYLHRNLIIASLFGLYLAEQSALTLLPYQLALNLLTLSRLPVSEVAFETIFTLSLATAAFKLLGLFKWLAHLFSLEVDKNFVFILSPFVYFVKNMTSYSFPMNEWYGASIAMLSVCSRDGSIISWILFYFNFDYIVRSESDMLRFVLLEGSLLMIIFAENWKAEGSELGGRPLIKALNICFLTVLHVYCEEEIAWIQMLFEGYVLLMSAIMVTHWLLWKLSTRRQQAVLT